MSDPVGFGFVIRGNGPVYVKTVDPTGPAAQAGLKVEMVVDIVRNFIYLFIGLNVLQRIGNFYYYLTVM